MAGSLVLILVGYIAILACVFGGFVLAGGHLTVLIQPVEFLIIFGAGLGTFIASNNGKSIKATLKAIPRLRKSTCYSKETFLDVLALLFLILAKARQEGMMSVEKDIESPEDSELFKRYPKLLADHLVMEFIVDYLRMMVTGNMDPFEVQSLMDLEIETYQAEAEEPAHSLAAIGDGMPAFGIVAAVMGVVHALGAEGLSPEELGPLIANAMVGTFLGILAAYGFINPLSTRARQQAGEGVKLLECIKVTLLANLNGYAPQIAVEFGRKALFETERPSFQELDDHIREAKGKKS